MYTYNTLCVPVLSPECSDGDIRLAEGANATEGRVEMCSGGSWGTVCDDLWGAVDAQVVCNQLGFANIGLEGCISNIAVFNCRCFFFQKGAVAVTTFPPGTGSILLDNVQCTGSESRLIDCPHNGIGTHNCVHGEDAGVRCIRPGTKLSEATIDEG